MRPLLIVAMPSSGSDWFAGCIEKVTPKLRRHATAKEYFNPLCNIERYDSMAEVFGCESAYCIENITRRATKQELKPFVDGFLSQGLNFTKEVWVAWQADVLSEWFDVVGLVRDYENTFPPSRTRVWSWYSAIAKSMGISGGSIESRCREAHAAMKHEIQSLPKCIRWEQLSGGMLPRYTALRASLPQWLPVGEIVNVVSQTAKQRS